jgi:uncharacterized protein YndB with AHSA1/START domain
MRYADGPTVEVDVYVDAPPSRVWPLVSDIDLPSRFSEEFQGGGWLDDARGAAVGARFKGRNRHEAAGEWETTSIVVACDPERVFAWAVGDPDHPSATWRFELRPEGVGTRLTQHATLGPGPSGLSAVIERMPDREERIIERRLDEHRTNMLRTIEGIKTLAEATAERSGAADQR